MASGIRAHNVDGLWAILWSVELPRSRVFRDGPHLFASLLAVTIYSYALN